MNELESRILKILYEHYWLEDCFVGLYFTYFPEKLKVDDKEITRALQSLEADYLIERHDGRFYRITTYGIDSYENNLLPSELSSKIHQREKTLEALKETYLKDPYEDVSNEKISKTVGVEKYMELVAVMKYLESKDLVHLEVFSGVFFTRLTANGLKSFEQPAFDSGDYMKIAYNILYRLENHLRRFIEKKLKERYGSDWWNQGISKNLRNEADDRSTKEAALGWKISDVKSTMEYLQFPDLSRIITNQWDVFRPIFTDVSKIQLKLKELEDIRNAIAHTRNLSSDAITRLEQYSSDILTLTKS